MNAVSLDRARARCRARLKKKSPNKTSREWVIYYLKWGHFLIAWPLWAVRAYPRLFWLDAKLAYSFIAPAWRIFCVTRREINARIDAEITAEAKA